MLIRCVYTVFSEVLRVACTIPPQYNTAQGGKGGESLCKHIICFIHWLYIYRPDLRGVIRRHIGRSLSTLGSHAGFRKDAGAGPSRAHILPLLQVPLHVLYSCTSMMCIYIYTLPHSLCLSIISCSTLSWVAPLPPPHQRLHTPGEPYWCKFYCLYTSPMRWLNGVHKSLLSKPITLHWCSSLHYWSAKTGSIGSTTRRTHHRTRYRQQKTLIVHMRHRC